MCFKLKHVTRSKRQQCSYWFWSCADGPSQWTSKTVIQLITVKRRESAVFCYKDALAENEAAPCSLLLWRHVKTCEKEGGGAPKSLTLQLLWMMLPAQSYYIPKSLCCLSWRPFNSHRRVFLFFTAIFQMPLPLLTFLQPLHLQTPHRSAPI